MPDGISIKNVSPFHSYLTGGACPAMGPCGGMYYEHIKKSHEAIESEWRELIESKNTDHNRTINTKELEAIKNEIDGSEEEIKSIIDKSKIGGRVSKERLINNCAKAQWNDIKNISYEDYMKRNFILNSAEFAKFFKNSVPEKITENKLKAIFEEPFKTHMQSGLKKPQTGEPTMAEKTSFFENQLKSFAKNGILDTDAQKNYLDSVMGEPTSQIMIGETDKHLVDFSVRAARQKIFETLKDANGNIDVKAAATAFASEKLLTKERLDIVVFKVVIDLP